MTLPFEGLRNVDGSPVSQADYLHAARQTFELPEDYARAVAEILDPRMTVVEGKVLVGAVGAVERFNKFRAEGTSPSESQFWANLLETNDLFGPADDATAKRLAGGLAGAWTAALARVEGPSGNRVEVVEDDGEVFVVIRSDWPPDER